MLSFIVTLYLLKIAKRNSANSPGLWVTRKTCKYIGSIKICLQCSDLIMNPDPGIPGQKCLNPDNIFILLAKLSYKIPFL